MILKLDSLDLDAILNNINLVILNMDILAKQLWIIHKISNYNINS